MKTILALGLLLLPVNAAMAAELALSAGTALYAQNAEYDIGIQIGATTSATGTPPSAAPSVSSEAELEVELDQIQASNPSIAKIEAEERNISVAYLYPGKLFGFIPVAVRSETEASLESGGDVVIKTEMPWWNFFVVGTGDVSARVDGQLASDQDIVADVRMSGNVEARERVVGTLLSAHAVVASEIE